MKIVKNKKFKKIIIIVSSILALLIIVFFGYFYIRSILNPKTSTEIKNNDNNTSQKKDTVNLNPPTAAESATGQAIKKNSIDNGNTTNTGDGTLKVSLQGIQRGNQVVFDTLIQAVSNNGNCSLSVSSGTQSIIKTSDIFANPDTSNCKGFSVLTSELPFGNWEATLTVTIGNQSGIDKINVSVGP